LHGPAVIHDVEIRIPEINDTLACWSSNVGVADVPLFRNSPVENRGSGRDFMDSQRNALPDAGKRAAKAVAGDAAADRIELRCKGMEFCADLRAIAAVQLCCQTL
jgi:hypothetical protein